jgi:hypothetical protein
LGKPLPRKIVINYRTEPGSPEYVAVLSDWEFPSKIPTAIIILVIVIALAYAPDALARWGGGGFGGGGRGFRRFGGGGGGFHGFGGDGFGGGTMGHSYSGGSSWDHSSSGSGRYSGGQQPNGSNGYSSFENKSGNTYNSYYQYKSSSQSGTMYGSSNSGHSDYDTYNANQMDEQQSRYNEANTLQENQETTEKQMHNESVNAAYNINNNNISTGHYGDGSYYGGGSSYGPYSGCRSDGGSSTGDALGAVGGMAVGSMMTSAAQSQAPTTTIIQTAPPLGTTLYSLPLGAYSTTVNGSMYYVAGSTYYKSYFNGSQVIYVATNPY